MKLLELCMIVKNSGEILRSCLKDNKKWIDHWTILDTGSTDNTMEIIKDELKDIPGTLHQGEFVDFCQARNLALSLLSNTCKFVIMIDDSYTLYGGDKLRDILKKDKKTSCFLIKIGKYIDNHLRDDYYSKRITRCEDKLRYHYRVHEDIDVSENKIKCIQDEGIFLDDIECKEHTKRSFKRYKRDIELLLLDHKDNPNEQRTIYYLAKTYHVMEDYNNALEYYEKLKNLKNVREDFLFSAIYETACIKYFKDDNINFFKEMLFNLQYAFPYRAEPIYKLAVIFKDEGDIIKSNELITKIISYQKPIFLGTLLENDIYEYYIPYLYIETNLILKNIETALPILKKLISIYPNDQPLLNMKYSICDNLNIDSIELSDGKTLVIHTGCSDLIYAWNPLGDQRISGSEYMAMNIAKEFLKLGYRVFIIGTFEDKDKNINYEGIYDNIQYIDYKYFSEFALKYVIDYLIISRYASNLIYYDNIKNVYLWLHDVLPLIGNNSRFIQYHKHKFKSLIAITDWQKENTVKKLNIPSESIYVSRNAIYPERFLNKTVEKIPYRFIYSSCPERGLEYLIEIIPKIKEKYPKTTLHLFVYKDRVYNHTMESIKKLDYVFLNDRIPQEELAIEFLKSDIWLYPTNFPESYCITALEAMAAKCLVATVNYCGLGNVVKGRGILCEHPIQDNLDKLLEKLFFIMDKPDLKKHYIDRGYSWAIEQNYENLVLEWEEKLFTL